MEIRTFQREHIVDVLNSRIVAPPEASPFIMSGAFPEETLNRWLFSLHRRGCESPITWRNYATEMRFWAEYLLRNNRTYLDSPSGLKDLFSEYRWLRLSGEDPFMPYAISRNSWNTKLAAMGNFYEWANSNNVLEGYPYDRRTVTIRLPGGGTKVATVNSAKVRTGRKNATIKYLAPEYVEFFINVGVLGLNPDGTTDGRRADQNRQRNAAIARMLFATGLRVSEVANLLIQEMPAPSHTMTDNIPLAIPGVIAKRQVPRQTWISGTALSDVHSYMNLERSLQLATSGWVPSSKPLMIEKVSATGLRIDGKTRRFGTLSIGQRRRLIDASGASQILFLARGGSPISVDAIGDFFARATERCQKIDPQFPYVHPHMTRHTFAVDTLRTLIRRSIVKIRVLEQALDDDARAIAHRISYDPLLVVRDLLGHASVATTQIYLDIINPESLISEEEIKLLIEAE